MRSPQRTNVYGLLGYIREQTTYGNNQNNGWFLVQLNLKNLD